MPGINPELPTENARVYRDLPSLGGPTGPADAMSDEVRVFEITQPIGMFATLTYAALLGKACEERGLQPYVLASSKYYRAGNRAADWFSRFFAHRGLELSPAEIAGLRRHGNGHSHSA